VRLVSQKQKILPAHRYADLKDIALICRRQDSPISAINAMVGSAAPYEETQLFKKEVPSQTINNQSKKSLYMAAHFPTPKL